ncbi:MAG TPA: LysM peptidoglycan-binding domain-containing protein [Prolixibacteraceae bacterium]|nr:LysM peptidoglycan-binding domain-containing protein [Prolixibacteraceae bacterium]
MMRNFCISFIVVFLTGLVQEVRSEIPVLNYILPMKRIEISRIDTSGQLDTFMAYPDELLDDIFSIQLDSLMNDWYIRKAFLGDSNPFADTTRLFLPDEMHAEINSEPLSDSLIIQRLEAIQSSIPLSYNETVKNMITLYTRKRSSQVEIMLGLANYYFPIFEEILDRYQLPLELKYMAIIESALNARALSRAGASGLWQFVYGTGKMYGLEITSFVDERRDPVRSTEAAARYLSDLYAIYKDWHLVIAAYNCGPGNVNKAIARSGGKRDYWTIYYRLPKETRGYVPAFISAAYTMNYFREHRLTPREPSFNIMCDTLMIEDYLHLDQVANQLKIDIEMLRDLNPMYRLDVIPATPNNPYPLKLPHNEVVRFIENEASIFAHSRDKYFPNNQIKNPAQTAYHYVPVDVKGKEKVYYTVQSGDAVGLIAEWFKVRTADIRYWNNLRGNLIRVGQKLLIYVPDGKAEYYKSFNSLSFEEKQRAIGINPDRQTSAQNTPSAESTDPNYIYHTVRKGDNLWEIARQYPGISAENIQKLNNITNTGSLYPGQKLKIKKKS